jgi:PIN domain nuclease of toxin-antitoxin system
MPEMIVIDTHIWFWLMTEDFQKFPDAWREAIDTAPQVGVSAISCYEIAIANKKGRLELPCLISEWFKNALTPSGITLLPLTSEISCRAVNLSKIHRDPFDRLIISTALEYGAKLASIDGLFSDYPELGDTLLKP